ncbi:hypothetical protein MHO82_15845 [Vibrio sp. Of7-15]|uniref:hypothetical protein n=1 Tax=Vibrio sp. Of7-15 TaxID=2724879 RepID=UPI001EF3764D|nr:hypothetical protein [Vibrio sp. Of7-15]MCG7498341.1 hypothetical protein [Vibrio sp. Of7-15]
MPFITSKLIPVILTVSALGAGFFAPELIAQFSASEKHNYCELGAQACEQKNTIITLSDDIVQPLKPSTITVKWPEENMSQPLLLELQGQEMEMGTYKLPLTLNDKGLYTGEVMLPICTEDSMTWQGSISSKTNQAYISIRMEQ